MRKYKLVLLLSVFIFCNLFINQAFASITTNFTITSGSDSSNGAQAPFSLSDITKLSTSDDSRIQSNTISWPTTGAYDESKYIEFIFSPNIPSDAVIGSVTLSHEFLRSGALTASKLEIWDGLSFTDKMLTNGSINTDHTDVVDISAIVDTPSKVNNLKARFLAYRGTGGNTKTSHDFVNLSATYTIPVTLSSIAITTPASKLSYTVGEPLNVTGLVVTGTYSDASTQMETVTTADVTGFDSSAVASGQVLTITVNGKTTTYTVDIVAPLSSDKSITQFDFTSPFAVGSIDELLHTIDITVPFGTDVTTLTPLIQISGLTVSPASMVMQDFTSPVIYNVTAQDSTTQDYTVTVNVALPPSDISSLTSVIANAQTKYNSAIEGINPGDYIAGSKAILFAVIDSATQITTTSSQIVVDTMVTTLNDAVNVFDASIVPTPPPDPIVLDPSVIISRDGEGVVFPQTVVLPVQNEIITPKIDPEDIKVDAPKPKTKKKVVVENKIYKSAIKDTIIHENNLGAAVLDSVKGFNVWGRLTSFFKRMFGF